MSDTVDRIQVDIQVVIPVYRNAESLEILYQRLSHTFEMLKKSWRIIFVNDHSPDRSMSILKKIAKENENVAVLSLKDNIGQHLAVLTGLWCCREKCSYVVVMDADLQDPPEAIPDMIQKLDQGYGAVFAGRRGRYQSSFRHLTSIIFKYLRYIISKIPSDAGMFVVMKYEMVEKLNTLTARWPSVVSMIGWAGLPIAIIPVKRSSRPTGRSAYNGWKRLKAAYCALVGGICWRCFPKELIRRKTRMANHIEEVIGYLSLDLTKEEIK